MRFKTKVSDTEIEFSELSVNSYKDLLKSIYGDEPDIINYSNVLVKILSELSNNPENFYNNLDLLSMFLLILDLRVQTFGDTCQVLLKQKDKKEKTTLTLNLEKIKRQISSFLDVSKTVSLFDNKIEIDLAVPSIKSLTSNKQNYLEYVKIIRIRDLEKNKIIHTFTEKEDLIKVFETLPAKTSYLLVKEFNIFIKELENLNFLEDYGVENKLGFVPTVDTLLWYTKLFFSESLEVFYDNLFYLSYLGHFNLQYIDNCAVGEYLWFVRKLESTLAQKSSSSSTEQPPQYDPNQFLPEDLQDDQAK